MASIPEAPFGSERTQNRKGVRFGTDPEPEGGFGSERTQNRKGVRFGTDPEPKGGSVRNGPRTERGFGSERTQNRRGVGGSTDTEPKGGWGIGLAGARLVVLVGVRPSPRVCCGRVSRPLLREALRWLPNPASTPSPEDQVLSVYRPRVTWLEHDEFDAARGVLAWPVAVAPFAFDSVEVALGVYLGAPYWHARASAFMPVGPEMCELPAKVDLAVAPGCLDMLHALAARETFHSSRPTTSCRAPPRGSRACSPSSRGRCTPTSRPSPVPIRT